MHKLYYTGLIFVCIFLSLSFTQPLHAISTNVVISQVKVGNSATSRLVEVYNNSDIPVDITGWCLYYSSPSNTSPYTNLGCFSNSNPSVHIFINARSYALLASTQTGLLSDILLVPGLGSGTSGHVYLMDKMDNIIDRVGWGLAVNAEANHPAILDSAKIIERKADVISSALIDTDDNENDFVVSTLRTEYKYGALSEIIDVCTNIFDIQQIIPDDMELDENGDCVQHDECSNLPDIQVDIPYGYKRGVDNNCALDLLPLKITELLPNATGSDDGNEFIEIYNPNDSDIDLVNYVFYVGTNDTTFYNFPTGSQIKADQYVAFSNDDIKFTLVNTTGSVRLYSTDNFLIDETPIYENPGDGMAWALIDGVWQYTNQPTPGSANMVSLIETKVEVDTKIDLQPCADNQYRSPDTNRCRLIETVSSTLVPCQDGQYRSEETNRCRSIASDIVTLIPCAEGQERNPDTNRCRSVTAAVLGASDLVACKEGQERNPDTNRCRNIVSSIPAAAFAPEQTNEPLNNYIGWWVLAGVGLVAIIYGVWEWRQEIMKLTSKIGYFLHLKK